jgi:DNA primase
VATTRTRNGGDDWVERVRASTDIVELIGQHVALKRVGRNWTGLCPFHPDKSPSLSVNPDRQFYHCFGCGAGGDVFKFVQEFEKVSFPEAVESLSRRAGIPVPPRQQRDGGVRGPLLEALESAAAAYQQWLLDPRLGSGARDYLAKRGLSEQTVREFRLGYAPPGWENLVQRLRGRVPEGVLVQAGLASRREGARGGLYDRFRERLMVPLVEPGGRVVGFGARALGDDPPKYLNSPETPVYRKGSFLFALDRARRAVGPEDEMIVVEGYFDAMALHQAGMRNTVATSGTALTAEQAVLMRRAAGRVLLTYDGDDAGRDAVLRSLGVLLAEGLEVRVADLPLGEDPDTLVGRGGLAAWEAVRGQAHDPVGFIQRHVQRRPGPGDARERALEAVAALVASVGDPVRGRLLAERADEVFGVRREVIERAVQLRRSGQSDEPVLRAALRARDARSAQTERVLLRALLHDPALVQAVRDRVGPEDFTGEDAHALAEQLWAGQGVAAADLPLARELLAQPAEGWDWAVEAEAFARKLQRRRLEQQKRHIDDRLRHVADEAEKLQLMTQANEIATLLRQLSS